MSHQTRKPQTESPLDRATLTVATLASVLGAMVTSAVGSGFLASLIAAAIVPAVTAFLMHPGPHRRRRIGAVLTLVMLLRGGREAMAKTRRTSAPAARKRSPALNASLAFVVAVVALTLVELMIGHAAIADRQLTLLPDESTTSTARAQDEVSASPPVLFVPDHRIVRKARTAAGARVTFHVRAVDSQGDRLTPRCLPGSGSRFPIGDTVVHCTATDRHGLNAGARFTVRVEAGRVLAAEHTHRPAPRERVEAASPAPPSQGTIAPADELAPQLDLPAGVTVQATSPQGAVVRYDTTAVDARDGSVTTSCAPVSGSRFAVGRTLVTCSATDRAGNTASGSFAVTVRPMPVDAGPPRLHLPKRVEREAADRSGVVVEYTARAIDRRDGRVTVDCEPPSGSRFRPGRTTVRCSATDRAGNVARGRFPVVVRTDTAAPRLALPQDIESADPVVEYTATAVDARDGRVPVDCEPPSGSRFPVGRTTVTCAASDRAGNTAHGSFAVVVREAPAADRVPPVLTLPQDITTEEQGSSGTPVAYQATAVDDRDGAVPVTCTPPSGSEFTRGTTTVSCSATDRAGNAAEGTFRVTVNEPPDTEPPVLRLPDGVTRTTDSFPIAIGYEASAEDNRDGDVPIRCDPPSGSPFSRGETTVTCTASDRAGNVATGSFVVSVAPPPQPPPPPPPPSSGVR